MLYDPVGIGKPIWQHKSMQPVKQGEILYRKTSGSKKTGHWNVARGICVELICAYRMRICIYVPDDKDGFQLLFCVISDSYASMSLTTNLEFSNRGVLFTDGCYNDRSACSSWTFTDLRTEKLPNEA